MKANFKGEKEAEVWVGFAKAYLTGRASRPLHHDEAVGIAHQATVFANALLLKYRERTKDPQSGW